MMKLRKGSITVFLCIVLAVLIPLCGILIDLTRYNEAKKIAESSLKVCTESMLAAYDTQLKEQFGLFAMYPRDTASIKKEIYELLSDNLTPENAEGKVTDLYGFKVNRVEVFPIYNYSEPYVLEQQVTEFMKYRAPIQAISEFVEKLKTMGGLMKEGDMIEKNMNIDKLLNGIRENMVYLALLLDEKMKTINKSSLGESMRFSYIQHINDNNGKVESSMPNAERFDGIQKYRDQYPALKAALDNALKIKDDKYGSLTQAQKNYDAVSIQLADKQKKLDDESEKENSDTTSLEAEIAGLQAQLGGLSSTLGAASDAYSNASDAAEKAQSDADAVLTGLNTEIGAVLTCYQSIDNITSDTLSFFDSLIGHLQLHIDYCSKAIELVNAIIPQANEIKGEKDALEQQVNENSDSAVSGQIGADLKKKLLSVDINALGNMITQFEMDKKHLEDWLKAASDAKNAYVSASENIQGEIAKLNTLKTNPGDTNIGKMEKYTGYNGIPDIYNTFCNNISGLSLYPEMKEQNIYVIPDYTLEPPPTDKEKDGFHVWYANTFEDAQLKPEEEKDNGDLDKAKTGLGDSSKEIATSAVDTGSFISIDDLAGIMESGFLPLPSLGGGISSDANLKEIGAEVYDTRQDQAVTPFDAAPQGYGDKLDEKQKNFFDYEMERIRKLLDLITNLLSDTGESLIKSLYMNEYIVSAFNNYTTKNSKPEYDIGWNRPLDTAYFKGGEAEYVVFGNAEESKNVSASKRTIFAMRLIFNLLHVYTDPEKMSFALSMATTLAGWTIFGVPIVQNLILIGWAALESWMDADALMSGKKVPLIKTRQSWVLGIDTLKDYLLNKVAIKAGDILKEEADKAIDTVLASLEETVTSFIDAQIDNVFSGIEKEWQTVSTSIDDSAQTLVNQITFPDISNFPTDTLDNFLGSLKGYIDEQVNAFCTKIKNSGAEVIADCKAAIKKKINELIFGSKVYVDLKEKIKKFAEDSINKGVSFATDKLGGMLGASGSGSSGGNNVLGRLIMMDYTDYLRLMLLAVPAQTKALRVSDLMQMDMYTTAPDNCRPINKYYTALYVKAYIDIKTWVLPEGLLKKDNDGMIVVEWSMGY